MLTGVVVLLAGIVSIFSLRGAEARLLESATTQAAPPLE
jgi:hypothetical protein